MEQFEQYVCVFVCMSIRQATPAPLAEQCQAHTHVHWTEFCCQLQFIINGGGMFEVEHKGETEIKGKWARERGRKSPKNGAQNCDPPIVEHQHRTAFRIGDEMLTFVFTAVSGYQAFFVVCVCICECMLVYVCRKARFRKLPWPESAVTSSGCVPWWSPCV